MFRINSGSVWQANQCFQLFIGSPYQEATIYQSFWNSQPPVCTSMTSGVTVSCTIAQQDTLNILISAITSQAANNQAIQLTISNFHTPFSSQILKTINIRSYSDQNCQLNMRTTLVPSVTIQQATLPAKNVNLTTSSNVVGVSFSSNTLFVNFTPSTTLSLSNAGAIDIGVPYWYQIGNTGERMYSPTAQKKCSSNCFRVLTSGLINDHISITYDSMLSSCFGQMIQIQCRQFYNPIAPILTPGFSITTYDSEIDQRIIEQTQEVVYLDARYYLPAAIPSTNFVINPSNNSIATFSQWSLSLTVNVPMRTKCYIRFYLPPDLVYNPISITASGIFVKPDLDPNTQPSDLQVIYRTADGSIPKSSIVFQGCNDLSSLGKTPFGRLDIQNIQTQNAIKNSSTFDITIYNDAALTEVIAVVQDGAFLDGSLLTPGLIQSMKLTPTIQRVQAVNNLHVSFKITNRLDAQSAVSVRLPQGLSIPLVKNAPQTFLLVELPDGSFRNATILPSNEIQVPDIVKVGGTYIPKDTNLRFVIQGVQNQNSAQDAGDFRITTFNMFNKTLYVVDQSTAASSYSVSPGTITAVGPVLIDNPTNAVSLATYTLNFMLQDNLVPSGYLTVIMPPELVLNPSSTQSAGSCKTYFCSHVDNQTVTILVQQGMLANQTQSIIIAGVQNPRSFKPTGNIILKTLDADGLTLIDMGYNQSVSMTKPGLINGFTITPSSVINGATNTYTFSAQVIIPFVIGDKITVTLPPEIKAPTSVAAMNCKPVVNIISMNCTVQGQTITVTLLNFTNNKQQLTWNISGIKNAPSTQPATQFSNVNFVDSQGFVVNSVNNQSTPSVTNSQAATLTQYSLLQEDLTNGAVTNYDITFTPVNPIPSTASLAVTYPYQISLSMGVDTYCVVKTYAGIYNSNCAINIDARLITITNVFTTNPTYTGPVTVTLAGVVNPINNKPGNGFIISIYKDANQTYIQDNLVSNLLQPKSPCNYPCNTCSSLTQQDNCQTCWQTPNDPQFLNKYANGTATCKTSCDSGQTTNGNPLKHCQACDQSCQTCYDRGITGDYNQCIDCAQTYPFRLFQTDKCLQSCAPGMFATTNNTCALCRSPCQNCFGSQDSCTYCFQNSSLPQLFKNSCIDKCPVGYISLNGICTKCRSPCAQCAGSVDSCLTCDGSGGTKFIYQEKCWAICPAGSGPDPDNLTCFPCSKGCDLCDIKNKTQCLKCTPPSVVYDHGCVDKCPEGWHVNYPDGDGTACRLWKLMDAGLIPFPFLIVAIILSIVCLCGLMKKRAFLYQNKMKLESPQHTLTCIIVAIAPLQFLALICQWLLAYVYGTVIFAILPLIVTGVAVIINVFFSVSFHRHFSSKVVPLEFERRVRLGKMTRTEANKHQKPCDENFHAFKQEHACTVTTIKVMQTLLNFKINKALYSFFYNQPRFEARFTHAKFYRKMMTTYYVIWLLCIDIALIVIDITTLVMIEGNNQFWVTVIETLVLSIFSVILGSYELWHLKRLLAYTETPKDKAKLNEAMKEEWSDKDLDEKFNKEKMTQRRMLMGDLLKNVKHNKQLFLNNKLDELLSAFGNRKCSSMMDLATGWNLEDDPRLVITWPISPMLKEDYEEMGEIKFTKEDAFGLQGNNVYADAKSKFMGMDFGTQNDEGYLEFQDALNRKHGGLLFEELGDLEERRMKRKKRRRGRKNKYYAQIDHEDDQEAELAEASDTQDNLPMIAELEEQNEKQMRLTIQSEQLKQKEQALLRKKAQEEMLVQKQKREQEELAARQMKIKETELKIRQEQEKEQEKMLKQAIASKKLQEEMKKEETDRKERERQQQQQVQQEAARLRKEYEDQEEKRKQLLLDEQRQSEILQETQLKQELLQQQEERDKVLQQQAETQALKDKLDLEQKLLQNSIKAPTSEIQIPPDAKARQFNENDILGDLDRDPQGNLILLTDKSGQYHDKEGKITNQKGYLLDPATEGVVENQQLKLMFTHDQLYANGDLPSPFNVEKHNFNPHSLMGDFDYIDGKPSLMQSKQGFYMDKKGRRVNKFGWMVLAGQGHLVDIHGRKKFDKTQLTIDGDLQKLLNYQGKQFDIKQVMGQFAKDRVGNILLSQKPSGELIDLLGRRVTQRGYLCDARGNIIDTQNRVLWQAHELTNGEFIKIFSYSTFDISRIKGTGAQKTNKKGYLVDQNGNVIDQRGQIVFDKILLDENDDIPLVFRSGHVQVDVNSDMSGLMAEIEAQGDSSEDSNINEGVDLKSRPSKKRNNKKKAQMTTVELLQPTDREKSMASAYGGQAIGEIRRPGVKYDKERLVGKKVFRVNTAEEPKLRAKLAQLVKSSSGANLINQEHPGSEAASKNNGFMGQTQRAREPEVLSPNSQADSVAQVERTKGQRQQEIGAKDFEEIFGKDIDQFLEDSDWDSKSGGDEKLETLDQQFQNANPK